MSAVVTVKNAKVALRVCAEAWKVRRVWLGQGHVGLEDAVGISGRREGWSRQVKDEDSLTAAGQGESAAESRGAAIGQQSRQHLLLNVAAKCSPSIWHSINSHLNSWKVPDHLLQQVP